MPYNEVPLLIDFEIRDTAETESAKGYVAGFIPKTIAIVNGHNQPVEITVYGTRKGNGDHFKINAIPVTVAADTKDFITLTDYFPELLIHTKCPVAPTTGNMSVYLMMVK